MYAALYGSSAACVAAGGTTSSCTNNTLRTIPANPNGSAATKIYLMQTWARPDMVFPHLATVPNANYPTVPDGRPIVDTTDPNHPDGFPATLYYESLGAMTQDLHTSFYQKAGANPKFAGVVPVGDAFQRAIDRHVAKSDGFYDASGVYAQPLPQDRLNLWWFDYLHASRYGSYLSALVLLGLSLTLIRGHSGRTSKRLRTLNFAGRRRQFASESPSDQLIAARIPLTRIACLHYVPRAGLVCVKPHPPQP
jgi:hypothetical protein